MVQEPEESLRPSPIKQRASIPRAGETFGRRAEMLGSPIRDAVAVLSDALEKKEEAKRRFFESFGPRFAGKFQNASRDENLAQRAAWAIVNVWLSHALGTGKTALKFHEAEHWFFGSYIEQYGLVDLLSAESSRRAFGLLQAVRLDEEFQELLPYILEPYGTGSRSSVMRDPSTQTARDSKRKHGVFYTPRDVAAYMVRVATDRYGPNFHSCKCLDPASGTAIFLLAFAEEALQQGIQGNALDWMADHLYGVDTNPLSVESGIFVLLVEALRLGGQRDVLPFAAWHLLRLNFLAIDAIRLRRRTDQHASSGQDFNDSMRHALHASAVPTVDTTVDSNANRPVWLHEALPTIGDGCDLLIGNPPYGDIGPRMREVANMGHFQTFRGRTLKPGDDIHLFFIEMMWSLTKQKRFASSLVLPLSIAFNRGTAFSAIRIAMTDADCEWRFAFFDREPHALFGEDVKTRNAILTASRSDKVGETQIHRIGSTKLLRCTSRNRAELFSSIQFTLIDNLDISRGIPKLEGAQQSSIYWKLRSRDRSLVNDIRGIESASLATIRASASTDGELFVGATAYNFLNAFFSEGLTFDATVSLSTNPLHRLRFSSRRTAFAGYALLASRLAHWLWTVQGDGFHVSRWFLEELPIQPSSFDGESLAYLAELGEELWQQAKNDIVRSINKGKHSIAYRTTYLGPSREKVDALLCELLDLPAGSLECLKQFADRHVLVDPEDSRRRDRLSKTINFQKVNLER